MAWRWACCIGGAPSDPPRLEEDVEAAVETHTQESAQRDSLRGSTQDEASCGAKEPNSTFFVLRKTDDVKSKYFIAEQKLGSGQVSEEKRLPGARASDGDPPRLRSPPGDAPLPSAR